MAYYVCTNLNILNSCTAWADVTTSINQIQSDKTDISALKSSVSILQTNDIQQSAQIQTLTQFQSSSFLPQITTQQSGQLGTSIVVILVIAFGFRVLVRFIRSF